MQSVAALRAALVILLAAVALPLAAAGIYLHRLGGAVVRLRRFPPPGVRMLNNAAYFEGDLAVRRGRLFQWFGWLFAVAAVGLVVTFWRLLATMPAR